jgi:N-methylhydantoinase B/oxoprolinase/acetone carboxylase alpha subunit
VTREIIRGKLLATADEMGIVIARTSMSPVCTDKIIVLADFSL